MNSHPATERRIRPRQAASLPTMGLSLQEIVLLLEIAPKGWTRQEAIGLFRRIAREVCGKGADLGDSPEGRRWKHLCTATEEEILAALGLVGGDSVEVSGDAVVAQIAKLLKHDLDSLHRHAKSMTDS